MRSYHFIPVLLLIVSSLLFGGCLNENRSVLRLREIHSIVQTRDSKAILSLLDANSMVYLNKIIEANGDISKLLAIGYPEGVSFSTAQLATPIPVEDYSREEKIEVFFLMLTMSNIPVFSWSELPHIIEDQSECCDPAFVMIGQKVADNTYISTKLNFTRENGELKLSLPSILKVRERLLTQDFTAFRDTFRPAITDTMSYEHRYIESLLSGDHEVIDEFRYKYQKPSY